MYAVLALLIHVTNKPNCQRLSQPLVLLGNITLFYIFVSVYIENSFVVLVEGSDQKDRCSKASLS